MPGEGDGPPPGVGLVPHPPGVIPNTENPVNHVRSTLVVLNSVGMALALLFVILRVWTRLFVVRIFGKDDCMFG